MSLRYSDHENHRDAVTRCVIRNALALGTEPSVSCWLRVNLRKPPPFRNEVFHELALVYR
jgi:hypothetical protein